MFLLAAILAALACATSTAQAAPPPFEATVVALSDADTFTVERKNGREVKVRLHRADAPEVSHNRRQRDQPGGREALDYASRKLLGETVTVTQRGASYGRIVGQVTVDGQDFATLLVRGGHAWVDTRYGKAPELASEQAKARKQERGLWQDANPVPPWEWRAKVREEERTRARR